MKHCWFEMDVIPVYFTKNTLNIFDKCLNLLFYEVEETLTFTVIPCVIALKLCFDLNLPDSS